MAAEAVEVISFNWVNKTPGRSSRREVFEITKNGL
jgi:hypothetical protein